MGERDVTAVPPSGRNIGFGFQNYALFPHLTVARNVAFGLEMRRLPRPEIDRKTALMLDRGPPRRVGGPACPSTFRAASSSASRWRARWSSNRRCCCSTSPCRTSTHNSARK